MQENIDEILQSGEFSSLHPFLGLQPLNGEKQLVRVWRPGAKQCRIELGGAIIGPSQTHPLGLYEFEVPSNMGPTDYKILDEDGSSCFDPYAFPKLFGDLDIHLLKNGLHYELYDFLGSTPKVHHGVEGVHFAVWAPNAKSVCLIGDFNQWEAFSHPMRPIQHTGLWEIFMPDLESGQNYKYLILSKKGERLIKCDPVGHFFEKRPKTSTITCDVDQFVWNDQTWLAKRGQYRDGNHPLSIYELHLGSWRRKDGDFINYKEIAPVLVDYVKKMQFTHVELIGVCEHPLDESWGYQVTGYFAPTSRHGTPEDFQYFVNYLHQHEIGVILDWVPGHFPTDSHSIAKFDGTFLYEHMDPRRGYHPHWNTHIFNYGRWEVSNFLIASALFWLEKMHIDGLRVDAVSSMIYLDYGRGPGEWVPNYMGTNINLEALEFIKHMNSIVHQRNPDAMMIAEESTAFPGVTTLVEKDGLGFDFKWNLGWMNDTLRMFSTEYEQRSVELKGLTFAREYAFNEKFILVLSHDEVVHGKKSLYGKMPGGDWEKMADVRLLLSFTYCFPGKKLLFMGGEFAQMTEWNEGESIHWQLIEKEPHLKLQMMVAQLNDFYRSSPALFESDTERSSFEWVISQDKQGVMIAYLRKSISQTLLCIHHFQPNTIPNYQIPLKLGKKATEVFNSDSPEWGGSGIINGEIEIVEGFITISIAPLATQIFLIHG